VVELSDTVVKKRAAIFLACVSTAAYSVFHTFQFETDDDRQDIGKITGAFEKILRWGSEHNARELSV